MKLRPQIPCGHLGFDRFGKGIASRCPNGEKVHHGHIPLARPGRNFPARSVPGKGNLDRVGQQPHPPALSAPRWRPDRRRWFQMPAGSLWIRPGRSPGGKSQGQGMTCQSQGLGVCRRQILLNVESTSYKLRMVCKLLILRRGLPISDRLLAPVTDNHPRNQEPGMINRERSRNAGHVLA